jgi:IS5 family transposase
MPVEVLLRMLILKHLYQWSYKECEGRVADSLVLRWSTGWCTWPDKPG